MEKRTSGFQLAVAVTLAVYFVLAAVWFDGEAVTPADHAGAKVLGAIGGGCGIVAFLLFGRRFLENDATRLPGYVPRAGSGDDPA